jgi:hypothetical protein
VPWGVVKGIINQLEMVAHLPYYSYKAGRVAKLKAITAPFVCEAAKHGKTERP